MKFEFNFEKKHLYIISALIAVAAIALVVYAQTVVHNPGHTSDQLDLGPLQIVDSGNVKVNGNMQIVSPGKMDLGLEYIVNNHNCVTNKDDGPITATCPLGKKAIGGGYDCSCENDWYTRYDTVTSDRNGWMADCWDDSENSGRSPRFVFVLCANAVVAG